MKLLVLFFLITLQAWAIDRLEIVFPSDEIKQGEIVGGILRLTPSQLNLPIQRLKGETVSEVMYFHQMSPPLKREGAENYEAEIQVIFAQVPQESSITGKIGDTEIVLFWKPLTIKATEASGQMLWADFTAPDFFESDWKWLLIIPVLGIFIWGGLSIWGRVSRKRRIRALQRQLATELVSCRSYEDVVQLWQKKSVFLREFPQLENGFRGLESVLFRYQFKPTQSEEEKSTVLRAYQKFVEETQGGLRGI